MVKTLFLEAPYQEEVELSKETVQYLKEKGYQKVALFASVQFVNKLEGVEEQLKALGVEVVTSQPERASQEKQLLGCNVDFNSLNLDQEVDAFLYIGDGKFHPLALIYAQKDLSEAKEVICADPRGKMSLISVDDIKQNLQRYRSSLVKFLSAKKVGVIVTIKPGQEQLKAALELEEKYPEKKFYYFIDDRISFDQLENFPFVEVWVNTACPRIGLDEQEMFRKGVVNLRDALKVN